MVRISSITSGPRQSNFELLRIIAMFLVLVVHADFLSLGAPTQTDFSQNFASSIVRVLLQFMSVVCVNVFVLISGWFEIKSTIRGFCNYAFQCFYGLTAIYLICCITGHASFSLWGIKECLALTDGNWFIKAYAALYILSPILNTFLSHVSRHQFTNLLVAFYLFQSTYGWINAAYFIENGHSAFSFIGLYLLAQYVKRFDLSLCNGWILFFLGVLLNVGIYIVLAYSSFGHNISMSFNLCSYVNPLVVLSSLGLLIAFSKIKLGTNRLINWIAKSCFMVYLVHTTPCVFRDIFVRQIKEISIHYQSAEALFHITVFLLIVFIFSILFDQPRKFIWNCIIYKINALSRHFS